MEALVERLTTSEAAVAAGVSIPQIHRIIDERILPDDLYSTTQMRTFRTDACVLIAFYFETAELLTAQARQRAIRSVLAHCSGWNGWKDCVYQDRSVTVNFDEIFERVIERLDKLTKAREAVIEDPDILGGTPVLRGTRVPVYDIAAMAEAGVTADQILRSYPSLKDWQVDLASIYARAVPQKGRPRRSTSHLSPARSITKKRLRRSSLGG